MTFNPWAGLRGLSRDVWVLCTATFVNRVGSMALAFLVLHLTRLGWSLRDAGAVMSLFGVGSTIASPIAGRICDRFGARPVLVVSLLASGTLLAVYPFARSPWTIVALTLLWALTGESFRPASFTLLGTVPAHQRKAAFAANRLAINLGMSFGPAVGGFLARASMPALFLVDGATSVAAAVVLAAGFHKARRAPAGAAAGSRNARGASESAAARTAVGVPADTGDTTTADAVLGHGAPAMHAPRVVSASRWGVLADRRFMFFLAAMFLLMVSFFQVTSTMALDLVHGQGMSEAAYGLLFSINTVIVVLVEVRLNVSLARWPHPRALALGAFLVAAGMGSIAFASDFATAAATVVLWTFGEMILFPAGSTFVADITPPERRGESMGFYTATFGLGSVLAPLLGTYALSRWGADVAWALAFVLGLVASVMFLRVGAIAPRARQLAGDQPPTLSGA